MQWRDLEKGDNRTKHYLSALSLYHTHTRTRTCETAGGAWGLNFGSESETIRFLDGCTVSPGHCVMHLCMARLSGSNGVVDR